MWGRSCHVWCRRVTHTRKWPDNAEVPESQSEVEFRLAAAKTIKGHSTQNIEAQLYFAGGAIPTPSGQMMQRCLSHGERGPIQASSCRDHSKDAGNELFKEVRRNPFGASHA